MFKRIAPVLFALAAVLCLIPAPQADAAVHVNTPFANVHIGGGFGFGNPFVRVDAFDHRSFAAFSVRPTFAVNSFAYYNAPAFRVLPTFYAPPVQVAVQAPLVQAPAYTAPADCQNTAQLFAAPAPVTYAAPAPVVFAPAPVYATAGVTYTRFGVGAYGVGVGAGRFLVRDNFVHHVAGFRGGFHANHVAALEINLGRRGLHR